MGSCYSDDHIARDHIHTITHGWVVDLRFYVLFNIISVISGRWADGNERKCNGTPFTVGKILLDLGSNPGPLNQYVSV